jgi:monoamine oxidase
MNEQREADVAVVGAGFAGLAAARAIAAAGYSAVVLEARSRVGGRVLNQDIGAGKVVEAGGEWIGPTQDRMYQLAAELAVDTVHSYDTGDAIFDLSGKRYRFSGELPRANPFVLANLIQAVSRLERMARKVPVDRPWEAPRANTWDGQTLETWLRRSVKSARARAMLETYMSAIFATDPATLSLLHALFYFHSGTSFEIILRFSGGAQQDRLVGGSQVLATKLADGLGDALELEAPVRRIDQSGSAVIVESDRLRVEARRVVVAIPPTLAGRIVYQPALPANRDQLMQRLPQGSVIKVNVLYDQPFWRADGLSGLAGSSMGPVTVTADNSPPDGSPGILVAFVEGTHARRFVQEDPAERRKLILDSLAHSFGPRAAAPTDYYEHDWSSEEWTRGCYGAHFPPGVWTEYGPALRKPIEWIHWAGTETSLVWNGYMEGAVRSGERAATEVVASLAE